MSYAAQARRSWPGQARHIVSLPNNPQWADIGQLICSYPPNIYAWTTANTASGYWITAPRDCTVYKIGWLNGNTTGGNTDVAIYDSDGTTRLVSTGVTARSGNNVAQMIDVTDLALTRGKRYFVAMNHDSTTSTHLFCVNGTGFGGSSGAAANFVGIKIQAVGATALPDPFVPASPSGNVALGVVFLQLGNY